MGKISDKTLILMLYRRLNEEEKKIVESVIMKIHLTPKKQKQSWHTDANKKTSTGGISTQEAESVSN